MNEYKIIQTVIDFYGVDMGDVLTDCKRAEICKVRHIIMYFLRIKLLYSWRMVGKVMERTHAAGIHSLKTVNDMVDTDRVFRQDIDYLGVKLGCGLSKPEKLNNKQGFTRDEAMILAGIDVTRRKVSREFYGNFEAVQFNRMYQSKIYIS